MRPDGIVVMPPSFDQHFGLLQCILVDLGERPNLTIGFLRRLYFHRFARSHLTSRIPRQNRLPNHARCFVFYLASDDKAGIIDRGIVGIASDNLEWLNRDCIIEELTHILGLAQDTCIIRPSTFCGRDDLDYLPWYDALMVGVLYDPRLKPGMARDDALPLVRHVIGELIPRFRPPHTTPSG